MDVFKIAVDVIASLSNENMKFRQANNKKSIFSFLNQ